MQKEFFQAALLQWFDLHGRKNLPWQTNKSPYHVWVSEIMLQQTQVATVIPYYERFIVRFPHLAALADASVDEVTALWAGLGYYARARNLHRAAGLLMERHAGEFPGDLSALMSLPGVGRSTAGAILSLGLGIPATILDGNVKRVLCRVAGIEGWPGESGVLRELWDIAESLTPSARVADYNQAMMDLGATICLPRKPLCGLCPLHTVCKARALDATAIIPAAKPSKSLPVRECYMLLMASRSGSIFLERRPPAGIWGGLLSLPEFGSLDDLTRWCVLGGIDVEGLETWPRRRHTFSHYHLEFFPVLVTSARDLEGVSETFAGQWFDPLSAEGLPAPIRRLVDDFLLTGMS